MTQHIYLFSDRIPQISLYPLIAYSVWTNQQINSLMNLAPSCSNHLSIVPPGGSQSFSFIFHHDSDMRCRSDHSPISYSGILEFTLWSRQQQQSNSNRAKREWNTLEKKPLIVYLICLVIANLLLQLASHWSNQMENTQKKNRFIEHF